MNPNSMQCFQKKLGLTFMGTKRFTPKLTQKQIAEKKFL